MILKVSKIVAETGVEPIVKDYETFVLPLHYSAI